ncbi:MAG: uridine phosphorylase [Clostridia bacterium]|nr:uridine phosphorylase [Clostridia bacterium]MBR3865881.1 uridine phosphorylase [Clostridia bacterium]
MLVNGKQMHIGITKGDVGRYCILPGDPGRCEKIAALFDEPKFIAQNREFVTFTGKLDGVPVSVCSTGIGAPSAAIAVEELFECGVDTFIRIGTCGGINQKVCPGDLVIATGAVRQDGTTTQYVPIEFPAVADPDVVLALRQAAKAMGKPHHLGIVQAKDSFYGQHSPNRMPAAAELLNKWDAWKKAGVLASEMESGALFVIASILGARAGAVFHTIWNQERAAAGIVEEQKHNTIDAITAAVNAIRILIANDQG